MDLQGGQGKARRREGNLSSQAVATALLENEVIRGQRQRDQGRLPAPSGQVAVDAVQEAANPETFGNQNACKSGALVADLPNNNNNEEGSQRYHIPQKWIKEQD